MNAQAKRGADALPERLRLCRRLRREPGWAEALLSLARDLTLAEQGAVLARGAEGWIALAPEEAGAAPADWATLADAACADGELAVAAAGIGGRWRFAAALGPADPPGQPLRPAVLLIEVATTQHLDLALTHERMALLGAVAQGAAVEGTVFAQAPAVLASVAAEALLRAPDPKDALRAAASAIAAALPGAERVALVVLKGRRRLALSDQAMVEPGAALPRALMALAEEAADRGTPRHDEGTSPSPAERGFAEVFGARPLLSVPAPDGTAVLIASFPPAAAPTPGTAERLRPAVTLVGALAHARPAKAARRPWLAVAGVAAVLGLLAVLPRASEVAAPMVLQPERAQSVTAPFDGILEASAAQPGDSVRGGVTPLARLQTRELELELASARARAANDRREATVARAAGQPAQEQIALLSAQRADAQVAMLEHRLRLADIRAPADGVILAGDLRRSLGQPVGRGQLLFEIALGGPLRAEILVLDEHAPAVRPGQIVRLAPAAEPNRRREAVVERVRPMAELVDGRNVFRVIARLEDTQQDGLRPGMEGWARIETGRTTWLAWLLRDPVRWLRRQFWV
ncbi:MAG: hypothetical protein RLZZ187_3538 [Pseudomonadota bacterium]|jgi:biotin carboxyl carrier protein